MSESSCVLVYEMSESSKFNLPNSRKKDIHCVCSSIDIDAENGEETSKNPGIFDILVFQGKQILQIIWQKIWQKIC